MQQGEVATCSKKTGSLEDLAVVGVNTGKDTFHLVGFDRAGQLVMHKQIKRLALNATFEHLPRCIVGMEACLSAHFVSRTLRGMGFEPRIVPAIFNKWTSAICGPNDPIQIPRDSVRTDWEVELGVVIGKPGVYIDEADAMAHVAGFCIINDVSEREFQLDRAGTWDKGKGCDTFGPTGPWLVTPDELDDLNNLGMWLDIDGERMQSGTTATLIFKIPHLIAYCSRFMSLQPGDVISTGTPPGVGMGQKPPRYLKGGEMVTLSIAGLGQQASKVMP